MARKGKISHKRRKELAEKKEAFFKNLMQSGWMGFLFLLPFLRSETFFGVESPKFFLSVIVIFLLCIIAIIGYLKKKIDIPFSKKFIILGAFLAAILLATLNSVDKLVSFLGMYPHFHTGFLAFLLCVLLFFIIILSRPTKDDIDRFLKVFVIISGIISLQAILEVLGLFFVGDAVAFESGRAKGMLQNSDITLSYLLFVYPFSFYYYLKEKKSEIKLALGFAIVSGAYAIFRLLPQGMQEIFLKNTAGNAIFALSILSLLAFFMWPRIGKKIRIGNLIKNNKKKIFLSLSFLLALGIGLTYNLGNGSIADFASNSSNVQRFWGWKAGIENGKEHFLTGTGPGTISYFLPKIREKIPFEGWDDNTTTNNVHNEPIDYFAMDGILGLSGYLLWWGFIVYLLVKGLKTEHKLFFGFSIMSMFLFFGFNMFLFASIATMFLPWMMAAFAFIIYGTVSYRPMSKEINFSLTRKFSLSAAVLISVVFIVGSLVYWVADYNYGLGFKDSDKSDYPKRAAKYIKRAVSLFPLNDNYHLYYSYYAYQNFATDNDTSNERKMIEKKGEAGKILSHARRVVDLKPLNARGWTNYGMILLGFQKLEGNRALAEDAYKKALEKDPHSEIIHMQISQGYWYVGEKAKAEGYVKQAIKLSGKPTRTQCYMVLAKFYMNDKKKKEALTAFTEAKKWANSKQLEEINYFSDVLNGKE
ncbi:hypothetical protein AUK11_00515 [bacterium CG2_30_37_16]|nr:MAG: hypothetical protein AUK11_00515 [bacterium CG2_30_37_16]PIP30401.1 MAG: hypothetical protein COX25_04915 [bacterium (Candidatus Howlettbacteria) CG23_combo_of_CG06-09_8_20_14_all_37_9]PJB05886.1 MAG: hypothetical protein CO123_03185 [bacterium (Candidatus Howlettbacteria) CG_4_9_14_3_um_filter_37_10]